MKRRALGLACLLLGLGATAAIAAYIEEEFGPRPPAERPPVIRPRPPRPFPPPLPPSPPPAPSYHVPELQTYLDRARLSGPRVYGRLAVFPIRLEGGDWLPGPWWTLDDAMARGLLVVTERGGGGSVPIVVMENRSRGSVLVMAGEIVSGGKQARTLREDVLLTPGMRVDVPVFCVEQHRWRGEAGFTAADAFVPHSIQREMRQGAGQDRVWSEVARNNAALGVENATGSLEAGLKAAPVARDLEAVRRSLLPSIPGDVVGFIFGDRRTGRVLGAECFGRPDFARALLPKLLDAYAVDLVLPYRDDHAFVPGPEVPAAAFLDRLRAAGSQRSGTRGAGAGIHVQAGGLIGDGVSLGGDLVHFGCQAEGGIMVVPVPRRGGE